MQILVSSSASARLAASSAFIDRFPPDTEVLVVAATRGAADDFARRVARQRPLFGLHRFSLAELAARAATLDALGAKRMVGTELNAEAMAARVTFDALAAGELEYLAPVARTPGFPKALARTIHELRLARVSPGSLHGRADATGDLARLVARVELQLEMSRVSDRAALFTLAAHAWRTSLRWFGHPVLLLDVPLNSVAERAFADAVLAGAGAALLVAPAGEQSTWKTFESRITAVDEAEDDAPVVTDLGRLRR